MVRKISSYLPVFIVALACLIPLAVATNNLSFRFDTDYKLIVPWVGYAIRAIKDPVHYFAWNNYIGLGIYPPGDPTSIILSPWYIPIFLLFGPETGLKVLIGVSMMVAGCTMWLFLRSLRIKPWISAWGAMLYELSGAFAALVTSGHIERFGSYAVTPYIFYLFFMPSPTSVHMACVGIIYAIMYLSSDVYSPWLLSVLYVCLSLYKILRHERSWKQSIKETITIYGFFLLFSSPKLLPYLVYVAPYFKRPWVIDPYAGSLHAWLLPLSYIIPWRVAFFDRPFFQRHLGFYFNWYEYFAFISIVPFIFLATLHRVWKKREVRYALVLILAGALYLALKCPYSPFYWVFHILPVTNSFRVPQRIVGFLVVPILLTICFCLEKWDMNGKRKYVVYGLCAASIVWTYVVATSTMRDAFEPFRRQESDIVHTLRQRDPSDFYVVDFSCCAQPFLARESIPVLNFYYGWMPTYTPRFTNEEGDKLDYTKLRNTKPSYIITDKPDSFEQYGYFQYIANGAMTIWKTNHPTIVPSI
ncbi:hypothetical protein A2Z00_01680 [Candidatus Gottesmanbacteria bacterium RBG_13_45_10]|uniref:Glycosyltransferase RgtA/B/C/D-like domain-containing protein n=1 Tax=Candidatus Gottesmanbacteria bacterium RBG_13_45_10 TaxID=1798370 RepID=A0A1F5ZFH2_9BACT|nr:MAG: hypothetical protein A2Z00_01680 [Candidatus Gottesmanbacteria bacterium RBG_13_45_10]